MRSVLIHLHSGSWVLGPGCHNAENNRVLLNSELVGLWAVLDWIGEEGSREIHEKLRGEDDCSSPIPRLYVSSSFVTFFCESRLYLTSPHPYMILSSVFTSETAWIELEKELQPVTKNRIVLR